MKYPDGFLLDAYNFDDETMLVYDGSKLYNNDYSKRPYMLLSKKDGSIVYTLNINLPVRYDIQVYDRYTNAAGQLITTGIPFSIHKRMRDGQDFIISDVSSDTIYRFTKNRELIPFIVTTPSVHTTDPHLMSTVKFIADKFIMLHITPLDYISLQNGKAPRSKNLVYQFETGIIGSNYDYFWYQSDIRILEKNIEVRMINAYSIVNDYKEKRLTGELEQIAKTIKEDDNPIIMIIKFK